MILCRSISTFFFPLKEILRVTKILAKELEDGLVWILSSTERDNPTWIEVMVVLLSLLCRAD